MKSFLSQIVVSLVATASLDAAEPPSEFLDIPWSSTPARAEELMLKRPDVKTKEMSATKLICVGGTFADYPVDRIELEFTESRLQSAPSTSPSRRAMVRMAFR
ncbi:MAG: hypothetical protein ABIS50_17330 [Luteolibacter sp.]|uniref:hypothetical protein n=1 Tax=Luteolibacter sp. TaxID=1962973 RepID=UPI003267511D